MRAKLRIFGDQLRRKLLSVKVPCPICGSSRASLVYEIPNVRNALLRKVFAEKVQKCEKCSFVYTSPRLPAKQLEKYYCEDYLLEGLQVPSSLAEFLGEPYREIWFSKERDLQLVLGAKSSGRVLDIGCASGTLLWLAKQKGFSVAGVDVSKAASNFARRVLGIEVFCGQLEEAHFQTGEFDIVTMFHSLEHVPEPRSVLREIRRILANDGAIIVVVPNFAGWSARTDGAIWKWLQPQNHYSHFTPETLASMANLEGFTSKIESEEGRYGEEEIRSHYGASEIRDIHASLQGSEIVAVGYKQTVRIAENQEFASLASR